GALWSEADGFFWDVLKLADGTGIPMRVFSVVGLVPLHAAAAVLASELEGLRDLDSRISWFLTHLPQYADVVGVHRQDDSGQLRRLLSGVTPEQFGRGLARMLREDRFLSPLRLRSPSQG